MQRWKYKRAKELKVWQEAKGSMKVEKDLEQFPDAYF